MRTVYAPYTSRTNGSTSVLNLISRIGYESTESIGPVDGRARTECHHFARSTFLNKGASLLEASQLLPNTDRKKHNSLLLNFYY